MELSLIFNELSRQPAPDRETAQRWMKIFAAVVRDAYERRIRNFRTDFRFSNMELAKGYSVESWFNDKDVDEPTRELIKDLARTFQLIEPFVADLSEEDSDNIIERRKNLFSTCYEQEVEGLTYAYLTEGLGISFLSGTMWDVHHVPIIVHEISDDPDITDFKRTLVSIPHTSQVQHLAIHNEWITKRLLYSVGNGSVLWTKVKIWYPHLLFCRTAERQIKELKSGALLQWVIKRLFDVENYCRHWIDGGFEYTKISDTSPESAETIKAFGADREFVCPDGQIRLFHYHLKGKVNNEHKRIHIWPDEEGVYKVSGDGQRKIIVGYIGKHLPNVSDRT